MKLTEIYQLTRLALTLKPSAIQHYVMTAIPAARCKVDQVTSGNKLACHNSLLVNDEVHDTKISAEPGDSGLYSDARYPLLCFAAGRHGCPPDLLCSALLWPDLAWSDVRDQGCTLHRSWALAARSGLLCLHWVPDPSRQPPPVTWYMSGRR